MRLNFVSTPFVVFLGLLEVGVGLRTVPSGPCAEKCGDITNTTSSEIVCKDSDYSTPAGLVFAECISCQIDSNATDSSSGDSDLKWLLYNLRFAMSTCLWGYPDDKLALEGRQPCITSRACGSFEGNIVYNQLAWNMTTYEYCPNMPTHDFKDRCNDCLHQLSSDKFLTNCAFDLDVFTVVTGACENRSGANIKPDGSLFANDYVNITTGNPVGPPIYAPDDEGPIDLGTKIGIIIGGIVFLLALAGLTIVCCGQRRRRQMLQQQERRLEERGYSAFSPSGATQTSRLDTKWAASTMATIRDESPASATTYSDRKFSPYSSQYTRPVTAHPVGAREPASSTWDWPLSPVTVPNQAITSPTAGHFPDEKDKDLYEMDRVLLTKWEQDAQDLRLAEEWAKEASARGFTVAPSVKPAAQVTYFPPPPARATKNKAKGKGKK